MQPRARSSNGRSSRPSGTDGTDHPFRMTVDNRYKKAAQKKLQLQKLLVAQTAYQLVKAIMVILMAINGEHITGTVIASCAFGGVAVLSGTVGLRRSSSRYLNVFLFATSTTVMLSILPFLSGHYYSKVSKSLEMFGSDSNHKPLVLDGLEAAWELIGVMVQVFEILVSFSLLHTLSRKNL